MSEGPRYRPPIQELMGCVGATIKRLRCCNMEVRLELLLLLMGGPETVTGLSRIAELEVATVSAHLSALRKEGLVSCRAQRNLRIQSLAGPVQLLRAGPLHYLRIDVPGGLPTLFEIPPRLLERLHPGFVIVDAPVPPTTITALPPTVHTRMRFTAQNTSSTSDKLDGNEASNRRSRGRP